jgi:two-component system sensor histidine kinase HydH
MQTQNKTAKIGVVAALTDLTAIFYYFIPQDHTLFQELIIRFYYFPVFLSGLWFGFWGGVRVSILVTVTCLPHFYGMWRDQVLFYDELLELILLNLAGPIVGALSDREERQRVVNHELQTLAALGETAASVAHEMKNMVIPIRGFLRRIRENHSLDGKAVSYLEIVERESARLDKMTQDMLAFARHIQLQRDEVEVSLLVEEVRQDLQEEFRSKGIRLRCACEGAMQRLLLDREKVYQVLMNLLQNALYASSKGKEVRLLSQRNGDFLRIVVEDEGMGIHEENLELIFQPFFTTKPKGTGLGLAITRRIVQEHGGEIRVESVPGLGTRVSLDFPIIEQTAVASVAL